MSLIPLLILVIITCAIGAIFLLFIKKNKEIKMQHLQEINFLQKSILNQKSQINYRDNGLNNYSFSKYNLSDSLLVQSEINLF